MQVGPSFFGLYTFFLNKFFCTDIIVGLFFISNIINLIIVFSFCGKLIIRISASLFMTVMIQPIQDHGNLCAPITVQLLLLHLFSLLHIMSSTLRTTGQKFKAKRKCQYYFICLLLCSVPLNYKAVKNMYTSYRPTELKLMRIISLEH